MVVDTSALMAIFLQEVEAENFLNLIDRSSSRLISAVSLVEITIVVYGRYRQSGLERLDRLIERLSLKAVAFDDTQAQAAREAFVRFGKGHHPAGLNFGDCCSYALAGVRGLALLYKGDDFARTDIVSAASAS